MAFEDRRAAQRKNNQLKDAENFAQTMKIEEKFFAREGKTCSEVVNENTRRFLHVELRQKCIIKNIKGKENSIILERDGDKIMEMIFQSTATAFGIEENSKEIKRPFQKLIYNSKREYQNYLEDTSN